jgi:phosphoglycerate dehydrogenase-like enzyme
VSAAPLRAAMLAGPAETEIIEAAAALADVRLTVLRSPGELAAAASGADAIVLPAPAYSVAVRDAVGSSRVRFVQSLTAGYDEFLDVGVPGGVTVSSAGDAWSPAVAEQAVALLLAATRRLPVAIAQQRDGVWDRRYADDARGLFERTAAIIGFGSIGRRIAPVLRALGMRVIAVTRSGTPQPEADESIPVAELDAVLGQADAVVLAVPLTAETRGLLDATRLGRMREGAVVVNVSRGPVVETTALLEALRSGRLAAAASDVWDPEPPTPGDPAWAAPGLLLTPHAAGSAGEVGWRRLAATVVDNLQLVSAGTAPRHVVIGAEGSA